MKEQAKTAVLKIDVDTERSMQECVPRMADELAARDIKASFCIPTGIDESGLAVMRAFKQRDFFGKMIRNRAWRVFHPRTFLAGTLVPAHSLLNHRSLIARLMQNGHEIGLHGYSHQVWQDKYDSLDESLMSDQIELGCESYREIMKCEPPLFAAPAWQFSNQAAKVLYDHGFKISSSCRGYQSGWLKGDDYKVLEIPSLPATLDEVLPYRPFKTERELEKIVKHAKKSTLPVFGLHAEFEGGVYFDFFKALLDWLETEGYKLVLLTEAADILKRQELPELQIEWHNVPGRSFPVAWVEADR